MKQQRFSLKKRIRSFGYAINGLKILIREEHNVWVHLFMTICVIISGYVFRISDVEWVACIFAIGLVLALEAVNSAIENLANFVSPTRHAWIKKIKDLAAAGVLIGAIAAAVIGLMIFVPKFLVLFR